MKSGEIRVFTKSGNKVALLEPTDYGHPDSWIVERVDGVSKGKQMICNSHCLESINEEQQ